MTTTLLSITVVGFFLLLATTVILPALFGSPWHPLSPRAIRRILEFSEIQTGDKIYDLGSGEGRVLITAARKFGAEGVGVEIDPLKVWVSRFLIRCAGVQDSVRIFRGNFYKFDASDADVIYVYLTHQALDRIFPEILKTLKPTVKIVSYRFCLQNMTPDKVDTRHNLYLYQLRKGGSVNRYT